MAHGAPDGYRTFAPSAPEEYDQQEEDSFRRELAQQNEILMNHIARIEALETNTIASAVRKMILTFSGGS
jgi:hypothetical protein